MKAIQSQPSNSWAFSLTELLAVIAAIAIISSLAVAVIAKSNQSLKETQLQQDVASLNSAVDVFLANGGTLRADASAQDVITELKKKANSRGQETVVGIRGSLVDTRLEVVEEREADSRERAVWMSATQSFVIKEGSSGIREFRLNEELGSVNYEDAERNTRLVYNSADGWVWESEVFSFAANTGPSSLPVTSTGSITANGGFGSSNSAKLGTPIISPDTGFHALSTFPLEVNIAKAEGGPADAIIFFSSAPNVWTLYTEPFTVEPGTNIHAYTSSVDPTWEDSDTASASFLTDPEALEIAVFTPKNPVTFVDVGGPCEPGLDPPVEPVDPIEVTLPGGLEIPDIYESSDKFQFYWTLDGTDPRTSTTRTTGITFADGYKNNNGYGNNYSEIDITNPNWREKAAMEGMTEAEMDALEDDEMKPNDRIAYTIDQWDGESMLPIRVVAQSKNPSIVTNSSVVSSNIIIKRINLRTPEITYSSEVVRGDTVELNLVVDYGDMPVGARVYYTTDGADPGDDGNGNPLRGTLYTGSFDPLLDADEYEGEVMIIARAYPPEDYVGWFNVSTPSNSLYTVPTWDISGVASGWFDDNGVLRNSLDDSATGSYFEWSDLLGGTEAIFNGVSSRERIELGQLTYFNGSSESTGDVGSIDFSIQLDFQDSVNQFDYTFDQFATNNDGTVWENADLISLRDNDSAQTVSLYGQDYFLNLEFGESTSSGRTTLDEFQVQEQQVATAKLYGSLISLGSWWQ